MPPRRPKRVRKAFSKHFGSGWCHGRTSGPSGRWARRRRRTAHLQRPLLWIGVRSSSKYRPTARLGGTSWGVSRPARCAARALRGAGRVPPPGSFVSPRTRASIATTLGLPARAPQAHRPMRALLWPPVLIKDILQQLELGASVAEHDEALGAGKPAGRTRTGRHREPARVRGRRRKPRRRAVSRGPARLPSLRLTSRRSPVRARDRPSLS